MTSLVPFTERLQSIELVVGVGGPGQTNSLTQFLDLGFGESRIRTLSSPPPPFFRRHTNERTFLCSARPSR